MPSSESLIRDAEAQLYDCRQKNLSHLNDQFGRGFQKLLVQLITQINQSATGSEVSNLVNASKHLNGSIKTVFCSSTARRIERALDLPIYCLDTPNWHFQNNLHYFWQYANRAADDREWFDGLLQRLLAVSGISPTNQKAAIGIKQINTIDWSKIRARLEQKNIAESKPKSG